MLFQKTKCPSKQTIRIPSDTIISIHMDGNQWLLYVVDGYVISEKPYSKFSMLSAP